MAEKKDGLSGALASPMELTVGGVDLIVRPITLGDLGDMENWVRSQRMKAFREATEGMDQAERMKIMATMASETIDDVAMNSHLGSLGGVRQLISLIASRKDGEPLDVDSVITVQNADEVGRIVQSFSGLESDGQEQGSDPPLGPSNDPNGGSLSAS